MNSVAAKLREARRFALPQSAGICAYDLDECTVTLALDDAAQVRSILRALPAKRRAFLAEQEAGE